MNKTMYSTVLHPVCILGFKIYYYIILRRFMVRKSKSFLIVQINKSVCLLTLLLEIKAFRLFVLTWIFTTMSKKYVIFWQETCKWQ